MAAGVLRVSALARVLYSHALVIVKDFDWFTDNAYGYGNSTTARRVQLPISPSAKWWKRGQIVSQSAYQLAPCEVNQVDRQKCKSVGPAVSVRWSKVSSLREVPT